MEHFLSRYRNLSVLLALVVGQLLLLAYQVKARNDVPLIRVWAVTVVTPLARAIESVRGGVGGFFSGWVALRNVESENRRLREEMGALKLRNQFLVSEMATADRSKLLAEYRAHSPSKTVPVRVIGTGTGANSRVVYIDRGSVDGIRRGMAAITADGIVGRVVAAYPVASVVQLITEQGAVAGVISQKNRTRGTLKGQGSDTCIVDYVANQEKLEVGEWLYTSGADRVFPRGLPVGRVKSVREGRGGKEIQVTPSGVTAGLDEMLIVLDGVHALIPDPEIPVDKEVHILAPPPPDGTAAAPSEPTGSEKGGAPQTDADRVRERYRRIGEAQGTVFGGNPGRAPDFNRAPAAPAPKPPAEQPKP
jgi:rod shape-determining protein MreC